jgi:integrase
VSDDHRKMHKTTTPGIYRRGKGYVAVVRINGKQRKLSARTMAEAKKKRAAYIADCARGEFFEASRMTFREYAEEWVERYTGSGGTLRKGTRDNYRDDLKRGAFRFFGERQRLCDLRPKDLAQFAAWLCDPSQQGGRRLSDNTVRNRFNPVKISLGCAVEEGLIRHNPAIKIRLPKQERVVGDDEDEGGDYRAFSREQLDLILDLTRTRSWGAWTLSLLLEFQVSTGLRIGEAAGLEWRHLELGTRPHVKVRQRLYRRELGPPKTKKGRRNVPLNPALAAKLRELRTKTKWAGDNDPVFANERGSHSTRPTSFATTCGRSSKKQGRRGARFTRSGIPPRACCLPPARTPFRYRSG